MAQGTRSRWVRAAAAGLGVLLCTGLVGCMNWDKPKDTKLGKQPGKGLPGTPSLDAAGNPVTKAGQTPYQFNGPGANLQQVGGVPPTPGMNGAPPRVGTTGLNTNTTGCVQPASYTNSNFASPGISAPVQPGVMPAATGAPNSPWGIGANPPPPQLGEPVPPLPPPASSTIGGDPFSPQPPGSPLAPRM